MKILKALLVIGIIALAAIFFVNMFWAGPPRWEISKAEAEYLTRELHRRAADDCVLTQTETGYVCREFRTGKVFRIAAESK
jgi:hypothetical protein